jgi:hypothetical protein
MGSPIRFKVNKITTGKLPESVTGVKPMTRRLTCASICIWESLLLAHLKFGISLSCRIRPDFL